jgi:hypothetical protein
MFDIGQLTEVRTACFGILICRNEGVSCVYIYEPISIFTHVSLDLIDDRCGAFSTCPAGNQIDLARASSLLIPHGSFVQMIHSGSSSAGTTALHAPPGIPG